MAVIETDRGNLADARASKKAALEIIESLRTNVANQQRRACDFSTVGDYHEFYIDILMRLYGQYPKEGCDRLALEASDRRMGEATCCGRLGQHVMAGG